MTRKPMREEERDPMTGDEVRQLLGELIALADQDGAQRPALELLVGDVLTHTSVEARGRQRYLCVTALLPPGVPQTPGAALPEPASDTEARGDVELMWHADLGRHIVVHNIPLDRLADQRGVMDAILDTADLAQRWLAGSGN
jgi:hypothetical protein